jgi:hypothetical protein
LASGKLCVKLSVVKLQKHIHFCKANEDAQSCFIAIDKSKSMQYFDVNGIQIMPSEFVAP